LSITSALIALATGEPQASEIALSLAQASDAAMSAGTLHETLIVAELRGIRAPVERLLSVVRVMPLTERDANTAAIAYAEWGKGIYPAGLTGDDFAKTYIAATE